MCNSGIKWNFTKFIVDKKGQPVARHATTTDPFVRTILWSQHAAEEQKFLYGYHNFFIGHGKGSVEIPEPVVNLMAHGVMTDLSSQMRGV